MFNHSPSSAIGLMLALSATLFVSACNRQEPANAGTASPAATSVGTEIDDTVVTAKVRSALLGDQDVKGYEIKVETHKGMVLLSGFVATQAQIDRVLSLTRAVEGAKSVENGMTLKEGKVTMGNKVDDGVVTAKVKSAFLADMKINSNDIGVVTRKGEVQLSGFVTSQAQIDQAKKVALSVEGAHAVVSEMIIKK